MKQPSISFLDRLKLLFSKFGNGNGNKLLILDNSIIESELQTYCPLFKYYQKNFPLSEVITLPPSLIKTKGLDATPAFIQVSPDSENSITDQSGALIISAQLLVDLDYLLEVTFQLVYQKMQEIAGFYIALEFLNELKSFCYGNNNSTKQPLSDSRKLAFISCFIDYKWVLPRDWDFNKEEQETKMAREASPSATPSVSINDKKEASSVSMTYQDKSEVKKEELKQDKKAEDVLEQLNRGFEAFNQERARDLKNRIENAKLSLPRENEGNEDIE